MVRVKDSESGPVGEVPFREVQRFQQPWLWALILFAAGFAWITFVYGLFSSLSRDEGAGELWIAVLVWVLAGLGLPALFIFCRLVVEVRSDGLYYRYHPFHRRMHRIAWGEVGTAEARTYRPIMEYGGGGSRAGWRRGRGKAYNVYGNRGVQLELADGKRVLFGSQCADELAAAVKRAMKARLS